MLNQLKFLVESWADLNQMTYSQIGAEIWKIRAAQNQVQGNVSNVIDMTSRIKKTGQLNPLWKSADILPFKKRD